MVVLGPRISFPASLHQACVFLRTLLALLLALCLNGGQAASTDPLLSLYNAQVLIACTNPAWTTGPFFWAPNLPNVNAIGSSAVGFVYVTTTEASAGTFTILRGSDVSVNAPSDSVVFSYNLSSIILFARAPLPSTSNPRIDFITNSSDPGIFYIPQIISDSTTVNFTWSTIPPLIFLNPQSGGGYLSTAGSGSSTPSGKSAALYSAANVSNAEPLEFKVLNASPSTSPSASESIMASSSASASIYPSSSPSISISISPSTSPSTSPSFSSSITPSPTASSSASISTNPSPTASSSASISTNPSLSSSLSASISTNPSLSSSLSASPSVSASTSSAPSASPSSSASPSISSSQSPSSSVPVSLLPSSSFIRPSPSLEPSSSASPSTTLFPLRISGDPSSSGQSITLSPTESESQQLPTYSVSSGMILGSVMGGIILLFGAGGMAYVMIRRQRSITGNSSSNSTGNPS